MAHYFYNNTNSTAGNAALTTLATGDSIAFGASAVWSATGNPNFANSGVVLELASNNSVTLDGQLYGGKVIDQSNSDFTGSSTITIGATGVVSGFMTGISLGYSMARIYNYGMISGDVTAVYAGASGTVINAGIISGGTGIEAHLDEGLFLLRNSGTITAQNYAVYLSYDSDPAGPASFSISNSGTILADSDAFYIDPLTILGNPSGITGSVTNSGTIVGNINLQTTGGIVIINIGSISGFVTLGQADDIFDGSAGNILGSVSGGNGDDQILGGSNVDQFFGQAGDDVLSGGGGNDILIGGAGSDDLDGGDGRDVASYAGSIAGVIADLAFADRNTGEAQGDSFTSIEGLVGSFSSASKLYGNVASNRLIGGMQADLLDGRGGDDILRGGDGNDGYVVDSSADRVIEKAGRGYDTVTSTAADFTLSDNVEKLILGGTAAIAGHGNALDNVLIGNGGANALYGGDGMDILDGGKGADTMTGGNGSDTYYVDNVGDVVIEAAGDSNSDTVNSTISYVLPDNVEILFLQGTRAIDATGNAANNLISGNSGANTIDGLFGNDQLSGGNGVDRFAFSTALDATLNLDTISGFVGGTDKLQLSKAIFTEITGTGTLSAAQFYVGSAAHDASDRIVYDDSTGNLYYDPDGTGAAAQVQFATFFDFLQPEPTLAASDIQLVG